jgi:RHS repeat-associated protein
MKGKGYIYYIYDAAGTRWKKIITDSLSRHSTTILYIGTFVYQQNDTITNPDGGADTLQFMSHEEGRARWAFQKLTTGTTGYSFQYDFFEKDHLGNTRMVLTQERDTTNYLASMEAAYRSTETQLFGNIASTSVAWTSMPNYQNIPNNVRYATTTTNDSVSKVDYTGTSGQTTGPSLLLKVMSGDTVKIGVQCYYNTGTGSTNNSSFNSVLASLAGGLVSIAGVEHGTYGALTTSGSSVYTGVTSFLGSGDSAHSGYPKAYLNYIFLDDQFNYVSSLSGAVQAASANNPAGSMNTVAPGSQIALSKSGYLYIWVSNETQGWDVFFDNLAVQYKQGPLLEENHYYPFGLTMAGISDKAVKTQYAQNKYRYNGKELQNQEFSDGTGLEEYDYGARMQDPQLGVWHGIDPLTDNSRRYSPYAYAFDNPTRFIDRDGMEGEDSQNDGDRKINYMDVMDKNGTVTRIWDYADDADENGNEPNTEASTGASVGSVVKMDLSGAVPVNASQSPEGGTGGNECPSYEKLKSNYPGDGHSSKDVYDMVGGKVKSYYFHDLSTGAEANSCALRLSLALNKSGFNIDRRYFPGGFYVKGADDKDYILRVKDMIQYLNAAFGQPDIVKTSMNQEIQPSDFNNNKGIIGFVVKGWSDATGHVTMFNGSSCGYNCYFQRDLNNEGEPEIKTAKVMLWILK